MTSVIDAIDQALADALRRSRGLDCPALLGQAMHHAVFPSGKRLRPRLVLAVAQACGSGDPDLVLASATAIELLHCASLVHDDLPCFDAASTRRGQPSVHAAFGERLAVLAGDALIVLAFETLSHGSVRSPVRGLRVLAAVAQAVGAPRGIAAGQAWECEAEVDLEAYHGAKTGALFAGAAAAGALAAGVEPRAWHDFGQLLGRAFQVADDLCDALDDAETLGKPVGRDADLGRPSMVGACGVEGAFGSARALIDQALQAIPDCPGRDAFHDLVVRETSRLLPARKTRVAA